MAHPCCVCGIEIRERRRKTCSNPCKAVTMIGNRRAIGKGRPKGTPQPQAWKERMSVRFSGPGNPQYRDGLGRDRNGKRLQDRHNYRYRDWRNAVFARDNHTCQSCMKRDGSELHAHHVEPYSKTPELRYDVSNGLTLCATCHRHTHFGKTNLCIH